MNDPKLLHPDDRGFPEPLRERIEEPRALYVRGSIPPVGVRRIAIVGTRSVDHEGQRLTKAIAGDLARAGIVIVSGGAIGVDTLAHRAAVRAKTPTVVFLPSALDRITPRRNEKLFQRIVENGALVTEYSSGITAKRYHFHRRNRLIAAYADAVLVIRSKAKGGTMLTASAAIDLGTPLFVVPGSPEDVTAAGCNRLIREGAHCVRDAADVIEDMGWGSPDDAHDQQTLGLPVSPDARAVLEAIRDGQSEVDDIGRAVTLDVGRLSVALLELEMCGRVQKLPGTNSYRFLR